MHGSIARLGHDWLETAAKVVLVLNLLDALLTLLVVTTGYAEEANPFMDQLLSHGPVHFMLGKLTLVSLSVLFLWRMRSNRLAKLGLVAAVPIYSLLLVYHLSMDVVMGVVG